MLLEGVFIALALSAVAIGMVCALSCVVLGQLLDDPGGLWLGVGLTVYSSVAVPAATINAHTGLGEAPLGNVRMVAEAMLVAAVLASVFGAGHSLRVSSMPLLVGLSVLAAAVGFGVRLPEASLAVTASPTVRFGACALWLVSGLVLVLVLVLVLAGWLPRTGWQLWAGAGYSVIAVAHAVRIAAGTPAERGMVFSALRFVGLAVVFIGVVPGRAAGSGRSVRDPPGPARGAGRRSGRSPAGGAS
jgi:hypothetical protein